MVARSLGSAPNGDSAAGKGFDCVPGNPPRVIKRNYQLIEGIKLVHQVIFGLWKGDITALAWHGARLVVISQQSLKRRLLPNENVGVGCTKGIG